MPRIVAKRDVEEIVKKRNDTAKEKMRYRNGTEMHIETLIVLDYAMVQYHKDVDLENYILTVFNMVRDC